ncbi:GatB/YqeY [Mycobacterium sp. 236(2023)]|uniref:GatB/YqeY n=1 Tax=Mycobacterium sp. 236(2023) TaxID=3038163 RepID=UPI002414E53E|nr:GatB/YqeY [Mycobacterium sp. 236(2023)]MDG4668748.1 GatB/YqeY [Mycobacterium sp. 236(2023)]
MTEHSVPADRWRAELRRRLLLARKDRDAARTNLLRSALSVIDNAETPDGPVPSAGAIADSAVGPGAADIARRVLTDDEIRALIQGEVDERRCAADQIMRAHPDRAEALRAEADHLETFLCEV